MGALKNFFSQLIKCGQKRSKKPQQLGKYIPQGRDALSIDFLLSAPREIRQQEIFYHIIDYQMDENISELFNRVSKIRKEYQMIYVIWHLQGEVNNGGYYQYFSNYENCNQIIRPYYDLTVDCLKMIGCTDFSNDFSRALLLYEKCETSEEEDEKDQYAEEMGKLDDKYYENEDKLIQAIDVYIETHLEDFAS